MTNKSTQENSNIWALLTIGGLFFILGFITWLNGLLIPYLKQACELTTFSALLVTFAFYISYTIMALPAALVLQRTGFRNGMSLALWIMALGALVFIPAAYTREYILFLAGLFILGSGMALLQTAVNPYITILGPIESAAKRISMMGVANKIAGAIAPLVLAYFVVKQGDTQLFESLSKLSELERTTILDGLAERVVVPYIFMAIVLALVGIAIRIIHLPEVNRESENNNSNIEIVDNTSIWSHKNLWFGALSLFFYVGAEVIAGDTIIQYGQSLGFSLEKAKLFTSLTMMGMLIGYLIGIILIPRWLSQRKALSYSAILGVTFTLLAIFTQGIYSVLFIALLGISNALVWPAIWPLALAGLGNKVPKASAILIMSISGGALLPLLWGACSDRFNSQQAYALLVPIYMVIYFYSVKGYKIKG
jgi:glucose/galactose transporter